VFEKIKENDGKCKVPIVFSAIKEEENELKERNEYSIKLIKN
jgi:hypothetical protein